MRPCMAYAKQSQSRAYLQTPQLDAVMAAGDEAHAVPRHEAHAVELTVGRMSCRQLRLGVMVDHTCVSGL